MSKFILKSKFILVFLISIIAFSANLSAIQPLAPGQYKYTKKNAKTQNVLVNLVSPHPSLNNQAVDFIPNFNPIPTKISLEDPGSMNCMNNLKLKGNVSAEIKIGLGDYIYGKDLIPDNFDLLIINSYTVFHDNQPNTSILDTFHLLKFPNLDPLEVKMQLQQKKLLLEDDQLNTSAGIADFRGLQLSGVRLELFNPSPTLQLVVFQNIIDSLVINLQYDIEIQSDLSIMNEIRVPWNYNENDPPKPMLLYQDLSNMNDNNNIQWYSKGLCEQFIKTFQVQILRLYNTDLASANKTFTYEDILHNQYELPFLIADVNWDEAVTYEVNGQFNELYNYITTEGSGYYIWRVRPIGNFFEGGIANYLNWGQWSGFINFDRPEHFTDMNYYEISNNQHIEINGYTNNYFVAYFKIDDSKNWIHQRALSENKSNETQFHDAMAYFDNAMIQRQVQKRVASDNSIILKESMPDFLGRQTLQLLPIPIKDAFTNPMYLNSSLKYRQNINDNYNHNNFDRNNLIPDPLSSNSLINKYYDGDNDLGPNIKTGKFTNFDADIASAGNYPLSRTILSNDGLNRAEEISLPGAEFNITNNLMDPNNHTIRHYYTKATEKELTSFFGIDAPNPLTVSKDILIDQNNVVHISYTDMKNRLIMSGTKSTSNTNPNLQDLDRPSNYFQMQDINLDFNSSVVSGNSFKLNGNVVFPQLQNIKSMQYTLEDLPEFQFNSTCVNDVDQNIDHFNINLSMNLFNNDIRILLNPSNLAGVYPNLLENRMFTIAPTSPLISTAVASNPSNSNFPNFQGSLALKYQNGVQSNFTLSGKNTFSSILTFNQEESFAPIYQKIETELNKIDDDIENVINNVNELLNDLNTSTIKLYSSSNSYSFIDLTEADDSQILNAIASYFSISHGDYQKNASIDVNSTNNPNKVAYNYPNSCLEESFQLELCSSCNTKYGIQKKYKEVPTGPDLPDYSYDLVSNIIKDPIVLRFAAFIPDLNFNNLNIPITYKDEDNIDINETIHNFKEYIEQNAKHQNQFRNQAIDNSILKIFFSQYGLQYSMNQDLYNIDLYESINYLYNKNFKNKKTVANETIEIQINEDAKCKAINSFFNNFPMNILNNQLFVYAKSLDSLEDLHSQNKTILPSYIAEVERIEHLMKKYFAKWEFNGFLKFNYSSDYYHPICNRDLNTIDLMLADINKSYESFASADNIIKNAITQFYDIRNIQGDYFTNCYKIYQTDGTKYNLYYDFEFSELASITYQFDPIKGKKEVIPNSIITTCHDYLNDGNIKYKEMFYEKLCSKELSLRHYEQVMENIKESIDKIKDGSGNIKSEFKDNMPKEYVDIIEKAINGTASEQDAKNLELDSYSKIRTLVEGKRSDFELALLQFLYKNHYYVSDYKDIKLYFGEKPSDFGDVDLYVFNIFIKQILSECIDNLNKLKDQNSTNTLPKDLFLSFLNNEKIVFDLINISSQYFQNSSIRLPDEVNTNTNCASFNAIISKNAKIEKDITELQQNLFDLIINKQNNLATNGIYPAALMRNDINNILQNFISTHPDYTNLMEDALNNPSHFCIFDTQLELTQYLQQSYLTGNYGSYPNYYTQMVRYMNGDNWGNINFSDYHEHHFKIVEPFLCVYKNQENNKAIHYSIFSQFRTLTDESQNNLYPFPYSDYKSAYSDLSKLIGNNDNLEKVKIYDQIKPLFQINDNILNGQCVETSNKIVDFTDKDISIYWGLPYPEVPYKIENEFKSELDNHKISKFPIFKYAIKIAKFKYNGNADDCNLLPFEFQYKSNQTFTHLDNNSCYITFHFEANKEVDPELVEKIRCAKSRLLTFKENLLKKSNQIKSNVYTEAKSQIDKYMKDLPDHIMQTASFVYDDDIADVTLYYYDKAGNLVKTIPPKGVSFNTNRGRNVVNPSHGFVSEYHYDNLGRVVSSKSVDEEESNKMYYNRAGQLKFSRSAKDFPQVGNDTSRITYYCYDDFGRMYETGQLKTNQDIEFNNLPSSIGQTFNDLIEDKNFPSDKTSSDDITVKFISMTGGNETIHLRKSFIVKTDFSSDNSIPGFYGPAPERHNLRNKVNNVIRDEDGDLTTKYDQVISYFSYDMHGNVEFVVHSLPASESGNTRLFAKTDYQYDLLSGKVNSVKYNYYQADSYVQKYEYDSDNRITNVKSSRYGQIDENDASYYYYPHGPLQRIELGQDKIQGLDYTYTIQGWLKGINNNRSEEFDPGGDGYATKKEWYPKDEFGEVLGYYNNDFISNSNLSSFDRFSSSKTTQKTNLFDGNISEIVNYLPFGDNKFANYTFEYDILGRLKKSIDRTHVAPLFNKNYNSEYSYDKNGNILNLKRNHLESTSLPTSQIDNLQYNIPSTNNKLTSVMDLNPSTLLSNEFTGIETYNYDNSGNLKEVNANGKTKNIIWTADGKIKEIKFPNATEAGEVSHIRFIYDAFGNRVSKVVKKIQDPMEISKHDRTLYARDANGQVMAIYENVGQEDNLPQSIKACITIHCKLEGLFGPLCQNDVKEWDIDLCDGEYKIENNQIKLLNPINTRPPTNVLIICNRPNDFFDVPIGFTIPYEGYSQNTLVQMSVKSQDGTLPATKNNIVKFNILNPSQMPKLAEWHIYGNGVQGKFATRYPEKNIYYLQDLENDIQKRKFAKFFGIKTYEVKDHLGNIRTLLTDVKKPNVIFNKPAFPFTAEVKNRSEYYPFGWEINLTSSIYNSYRYSYNGTHLKDNEISGNGNHFDFGGYGLDPRIGRRWNLDPVLHEWQSDYSVFANNPIVFADPSGLDHCDPINPSLDCDSESHTSSDSDEDNSDNDTKLETPTEQKQEVQRNFEPPKLPNIEQAGQLAVNGQKSNTNTKTNKAFQGPYPIVYAPQISPFEEDVIKIGVYTLRYIRSASGAIFTGVITFLTPVEANPKGAELPKKPKIIPKGEPYPCCSPKEPQNKEPKQNKPHLHHIATDKFKKKEPQWTFSFQALFDEVNLTLDDERNTVFVANHSGPHPPAYHTEVYYRLTMALHGRSYFTFEDKQKAFLKELAQLKNECSTPGTNLNNLITK